MAEPQILWLRQDLRIHDHPALLAAAAAGPVLPVYILDDLSPGSWKIGRAQRWWLHHSLIALRASLKSVGSDLILRRGVVEDELHKLCEESGASEIHAIRHYEPWWRAAEAALGDRLNLYDGNHLAPIADIRTGSGALYKIYTPFWRALSVFLPPEAPLPAPEHIDAPARWPQSEALDDWQLLPTAPDWASGFAGWTPGEEDALAQAEYFERHAPAYEVDRNLPSIDGSSRLSPHLHFGEISPRSVWHMVGGQGAGVTTFRKEIAWRDFARNVILDRPDYGTTHGRERYDAMAWRHAPDELAAWQRGRTGYPIVDAGMRQLWATGWMHNRVRMIAASFLVKHLLIDWREGARWFWDTLLDADYGNNSVNWQWIAGTGIDANMWSRIMAPLAQSEKFDASAYIRKWVPELRGLSDAVIHDPHGNGVAPSKYATPIISHREARERALMAGRAVR